MPILINEFEVLAEQQPETRRIAPDTAGAAAKADKIDPCALTSALRVLDARALRTWAH